MVGNVLFMLLLGLGPTGCFLSLLISKGVTMLMLFWIVRTQATLRYLIFLILLLFPSISKYLLHSLWTRAKALTLSLYTILRTYMRRIYDGSLTSSSSSSTSLSSPAKLKVKKKKAPQPEEVHEIEMSNAHSRHRTSHSHRDSKDDEEEKVDNEEEETTYFNDDKDEDENMLLLHGDNETSNTHTNNVIRYLVIGLPA